MPIILPNDPDSPLTQGDILKGVALFASEVRESEIRTAEGKAELCIVLSRPCVAAHKSGIIVAEIRKQAPNLPRDVQSFEDARNFFEDMRDGHGSPDRFYLGPVVGYDGRFFALLDRLFTIEAEQTRDLVSRRVGKLDQQFARDLHMRIFQAFASLGFDDINWYATEDLQMIVTYGDRELSKLRAEEKDQRVQEQEQEFRGHPFKDAKLKSLRESISHLENEVAPFRAELNRRTGE